MIGQTPTDSLPTVTDVRTEWTLRAPDGRMPMKAMDKSTAMEEAASGWFDGWTLVHRVRTSYADTITEWERADQ